jgi:hypothetical protein
MLVGLIRIAMLTRNDLLAFNAVNVGFNSCLASVVVFGFTGANCCCE